MNSVPARSFLTAAAVLTAAATGAAVLAGDLSAYIIAADALLCAVAFFDLRRTADLKTITIKTVCPGTLPLGQPFEIVFRCRAGFSGQIRMAPDLPSGWNTGEQEVRLFAEKNNTVVFSCRCIPEKRGRFTLNALHCCTSSPLGFWRRQKIFPLQIETVVVPDVRAVSGRSGYLSRNRNGLSGSVKNRLAGHGMELAYLRESFPDDDPRLIDWFATMRSGRMVSRVYERDAESQIVIAVDCGRSMLHAADGFTLLDRVLNAVLAFSALLVGRKEHLTIIPFAGEIERPLKTGVRTGTMQRIARYLSALEPVHEEPDFRTLFEYIRATSVRRGLLYIITETTGQFRETFFSKGLKQLGRRHRVSCMLVKNPSSEYALRRERGMWERVAAMDYWLERKKQLVQLQKTGIRFSDNGYQELGSDLLKSYLKYKERGY